MDPLRKRNLLTLEQAYHLWEAGMFSIEYIIETLKENFEGVVRLYPYFNGVRLDMYGEKKEYLLKAGHMIIEDCFNKQISRIETQIVANDRLTFQVFNQLNFYQEGILREMIFYNDNYMDVYLLSLLQEEYERNNSR